ILQVGDALHYDFTHDYPEIKTSVSVEKNKQVAELWRLEQRYMHLLERYNKLLSFLVRTANDYHVEQLQEEINRFLERPKRS
ncbi:MAG: hypothetical protein AAF963_03580, partial [Bacteroidota bacterium]